jgi:pilus assembly protein Flp/PilA
MNKLVRLVKDNSGVTAIEYGLIAALVAVVMITAVTGVGTDLKTVFESVSNSASPLPVAVAVAVAPKPLMLGPQRLLPDTPGRTRQPSYSAAMA